MTKRWTIWPPKPSPISSLRHSRRPWTRIVYPSVQAKGTALNIVLFHKSARVQPFDYPPGTEIRASLGQNGEDGWETEYRIIERTPPPKVVTDHAAKKGWPADLRDLMQTPIEWDPDRVDAREPALALDIDSVNVHRVASVTFDAPPERVSHFRWQKRDEEI